MKTSTPRFALLLVALMTSCASAPPTPAPIGYVESGTWVVREDEVMRIAAGAAGKGTLIFEGWQYNFTFTGAKITVTGNEAGEITGHVYNLDTVRDFEGTYAPRADFNEEHRVIGLWATNDKGVTLHLDKLEGEASVNFGAKGATVTLVD
jgi:hypothetical protein